MSFLDEFRAVMRSAVGKTVSHTDSTKGYYVPNEGQKQVMSLAGYQPQPYTNGRIINFRVAGTDEILGTSYYPSVRAGSGRTPEIRMGRGIVNWAGEGDTLWLGTDATTIFAMKGAGAVIPAPADPDEAESPAENLARHIDKNRLAILVNAVGGPPGQRSTQSQVYERSPLVRAFARERCGGVCEMPNCGYRGFQKADGTLYIEVHHIVFMGNQGWDTISNVAALCANCHKRAHYARDRNTIRTQLLTAVQAANVRFLPTIV